MARPGAAYRFSFTGRRSASETKLASRYACTLAPLAKSHTSLVPALIPAMNRSYWVGVFLQRTSVHFALRIDSLPLVTR